MGKVREKLTRFLKILFWIVAGVHLLYIVHFSVDSPYQDEWNIFDRSRAEFFTPFPRLSWFFALHGQHYIAVTRLVTFLNYHLFSLDYQVGQVFNFIFYVGLVVFLRHFSGVKLKESPSFWILLLTLLSGKAYDNHQWFFQNQVHFFLFFLCSSSFFLFVGKHTRLADVLGVLSFFACLFSFGAGLAACAVVMAFLFYDAYQARRSFVVPICVASVFTLAAVPYVLNAPNLNTISSPFTLEFWEFFLVMLARALATHIVHVWVGLIALALILVPLIVGLKGKATPETKGARVVLTVLLVVMLQIAAGRSGDGVYAAIVPRYSEISQFALFFASALVLQYSLFKPIYRRIFVGLLLILSVPDWAFSELYSSGSRHQTAGKKCLLEYIESRHYMTSEERARYKCSIAYALALAPQDEMMDYMSGLGLSTIEKARKPDQ